MARHLLKGEKPLDWVGSSKKDFLGFPSPVKDEMAMRWVWRNLVASIRQQSRGKAKDRAFSRLSKTTMATLIARFTRFDFRMLSMSFMPFKRNRPAASAQRKRMLISSPGA